MSLTLGEIAARFGCELRGDPERRIARVGTLAGAGADALAFLANPAYRDRLRETAAAAVVLEAGHAGDCPVDALIASDPYATYARIAGLLYPPPRVEPGIGPGAVVDPSAEVDPAAHVGANAVVGARSRIGARVSLGPGAVVGDDCALGADTRLAAGVTLGAGVRMGARCTVQSGAVIGADGFGYARTEEGWLRVPQVGGVVVGDDVEIGANTTIDRGAIEDTVIGDGVILDNLVQIGHNVRVGAHTAMAAMAGIAGSAVVGERCMLGGKAGVVGHVTICDDVILAGRCTVTTDIDRPGMYGSALPHDAMPAFRRNALRFRRLDAFAKRLRALEKRVAGKKSRAEE